MMDRWIVLGVKWRINFVRFIRRQPAWEWQVDVVDYAIKKASQGRRSFVCH